MIEVENLAKRHGEKRAVDGLDFVVQPGIVTGFLGPKAAGKSTTMRMIAGLDEPLRARTGSTAGITVRPRPRWLSWASCLRPRRGTPACRPAITCSRFARHRLANPATGRRVDCQEVTMHNVTTTPASVADKVRLPELSRQPKHEAVASRAATAHSSSPRLRPPVSARDLHPGDLVQQCDWTLHVREVTVSQTTVAITVAEFGFPLHYAADTRVQLVACRAEQGASDPPAIRPGVWKER